MPATLQDVLYRLLDFMHLGGPVLWVIAGTLLLLWLLVFERVLFLQRDLPQEMTAIRESWRRRSERRSWQAQRIREAALSRIRMEAQAGLPLMRTLIALCPLLGLLGTVTGMIDIFDSMAFSDSGNARTMAAGVSRATVPTMAGMVAAVSGLLAVTVVGRWLDKRLLHLETTLGPE